MNQKLVLRQASDEWRPSLWVNPNKKSFFDEASAKAKPFLVAMQNHPFFQELIKGALDIKKNKFYTAQLAFYLSDISRALALVAGRFENPADVNAFLTFAIYVGELQKSYADFYPGKKPLKSPSCQMYTSYMLSTASLSEIATAVATLLPSCWMHLELMKYIIQQQPGPNNPYGEWIKTFCNESFASIAQKAIEITNQMAEKVSPEERTIMLNHFLKSSDMEYVLLNTCYNLEQELQKDLDTQPLQMVAKL